MASRFQAGGQAIILRSCFPQYRGMYCTLVTPAPNEPEPSWYVDPKQWIMEHIGYRLIAAEKILKPIYDGDQPSSWTTGVWRPKGAKQLANPPLIVVDEGTEISALQWSKLLDPRKWHG